MSADCSPRSHFEFNESGGGSGISELSVIGELETHSVHPRCSYSDLGDIKRTLMNDNSDQMLSYVNRNKKQVSESSGEGVGRKDRGGGRVYTGEGSQKSSLEFPGKSSKKRTSLGLAFNIQIFRDAKQLFNKKKVDSDSNSELYSFPVPKKENKKASGKHDAPLKSFKEFFPHVLSTTSPNLNNSLPPTINCSTGLDSTFQSISSTYPPLTSISNVQKNVGNFEIFDGKKTKNDNGGKSEEDFQAENGNYWDRGETNLNLDKGQNSLKCEYEKYNCDYCEGRSRVNYFSQLHGKRFNWIHAKEYSDTKSNRKLRRLNRGTDESSTDKEFSPKDLFRKVSDKKFLTFRVRTRNSKRGDNFLCDQTSYSSSSNLYDVTTDEEGDVDTSMTSSDEGLTSNLSLFTSAEGEDDIMGMSKENVLLCKSRENCSRNYSILRNSFDNEEFTKRTENGKELKQPFNKWREKLPWSETVYKTSHQNSPRQPFKSKPIQTTPTTTTITTTTTAISKQTTVITTSNQFQTNDPQSYSLKKFFNNKIRMCKFDTNRDGKQISKLVPAGRRGENNHYEKHYLATPSSPDARLGIPARLVNAELGVLEGLTRDENLKGFLPHFPSELMAGKAFDKSGYLSFDPCSDRQTINSSQIPISAALTSMQGEIADLSNQLQVVSREKELFESSLTSAQLAHARAERETNTKLDNVTQQYEERITELHSVIAELTRKLDRQKENIIIEEDEEDDVENSKASKEPSKSTKFDEEGGSVSEASSQEQNETTECSTSETTESEGMFDREESNGETHQNPPTDVSTSCEIDDRAVEAGQCIADLDVNCCRAGSNSNISILNQSNENITDDAIAEDVICQGSSSAGLEDELKILREENNTMQQALALAHHKASSQRSVIMALSREREALRKKLKEAERMQPGIPHSSPHISDAIMVKGLRGSPLSGSLLGPLSNTPDSMVNTPSRALSPSVASQHHNDEDAANREDGKVICKLAERVRLKKAESGDLRVTGSDLSLGVSTTAVAEQLAAGVQEESDAQELFHALATAGGVFAPHERLKEYELEAERLHARIDHLKAQNDVLSATLCESKACCDRLALKTGRAEAQSGALKLGVEVLDQIQEAFEVLTALHEAQIALLVVTCQVTGVDLGAEMGFEPIDQDVDPLVRVKRAQEQRRTAENVARHLLSRLDHVGAKTLNGPSESNGIHSMSSSTTSYSSEGVHHEEFLLRDAISRLQEERTRILSCFKVGSDSSPLEDYFPQRTPLSEDEAHKLDLENAVLMQELTAIREDRAELRAQVYLLEREKTGLELRIGTCEAQSAALYATIDHLKAQLNQLKLSKESSENVGDSGVDTASSEAESLRRESQLKTRIDDLVMTLEKVTKNSEARHRQSQEFINDLKKANSALLTAVDRLKKKYALRVKRMEQQTINLVAKHEQQVKHLKSRIGVLEEQVHDRNSSPRQLSSPSEVS